MATVRKQATSQVIMVRPARFGYNTETAANNRFQDASKETEDAGKTALAEFDNYVAMLRAEGVNVWVIEDSLEPYTPDSIFPNNWFSTHCTGEVILYPMYAPNRQQERKAAALTTVGMLPGVQKIINLTGFEKEHLYLEGTGSMCLDRVNRIVYCCASARSSEQVLAEFCRELDYRAIYFHSFDKGGVPIYHTNVMMSIAGDYAVVALESITDPTERARVVESLEQTGHEIVDITLEQVHCFAGNMLEVLDGEGRGLMLMSQAALRSLSPQQRAQIEKYSRILAPDLTTIETLGGGSARCMVAEVFVSQ